MQELLGAIVKDDVVIAQSLFSHFLDELQSSSDGTRRREVASISLETIIKEQPALDVDDKSYEILAQDSHFEVVLATFRPELGDMPNDPERRLLRFTAQLKALQS